MARRRNRGGLSDEDRALWALVARSVTAMPDNQRRRIQAAPPPPAASPGPPATPAPTQPSLPAGFGIGRNAAPLPVHVARVMSPSERLAGQPLQMDARTHRSLTRGKLRPDARLDLHGMTLAVAKAELTGFVLRGQAAGHRLILVITGKGERGGSDGGPLPVRAGALRHEVPHWLAMAPLSRVVLQVVPAHVRHGGGGAYYVWLRRPRG